uniref:Protein polybromo-1 n=1 Tax=Rhabditophanes sp. KR3021 TaxID=114890 RepID=A0AC35TZZ5_9BILA
MSAEIISNGTPTTNGETSPPVDRKRPASRNGTSNVRGAKRLKLAEENRQFDLCQNLFHSLKSYKTHTKVCPFEVLYRAPSKRSEPQFYERVSSPYDFNRIQQKFKTDEYCKVEDLCVDVEHVLESSKNYYPKDNDMYVAALELESYLKTEKERLKSDGGPKDTNSPSTSSAMLDDETRESSAFVEETALPANEATTPYLKSNPNECERWKLESIIRGVVNLSDNDGRMIAPVFKILEDPTDFPQYYKIIKEPIDLKTICGKIQADYYTTWDLFDHDIDLMIGNAKVYNSPRTDTYKDALKIEQFIKRRKDELNKLKRKPFKEAMEKAKAEVDSLAIATFSDDDEEDLSEDGDDQCNEAKQDELSKFYWAIRNSKKNKRDLLCNHFFELPSKSQYPDYYDEVEYPMSLYKINKKLKGNKYKAVPEIATDMFLIAQNAKSYNEDKSTIYKDADALVKLVKEELANRNLDMIVGKTEATAASSPLKKTPKTPAWSIDSGLVAPRSKYGNIPGFTPVAGKKGRKSIEERWAIYTARLLDILNRLSSIKSEDGRSLVDAFVNLSNYFPQPYGQPIMDVGTVKEKVDSRQYKIYQDFEQDVYHIFDYVSSVCPPTDIIYHDSQVLRSQFGRMMLEAPNKDQLQAPTLLKELKKRGLASIKVKKELAGDPDTEEEESRQSSVKTPVKCSRVKRPPGPAFSNHSMTLKPTTGLSKETLRIYEFYNEVVNVKACDGRLLCTQFEKLPTKEEYPDYYEEIKKPMDLERIKSKLSGGSNPFPTTHHFFNDILLVFSNACTFNDPESQLYVDAFTLQKFIMSKKRDFCGTQVLPCAQVEIKRLLNKVIGEMETHSGSNGRCYAQSFANHKELFEGADLEEIPFSLSQIRKNVENGCYRRFDRFQADVFYLFSSIRKVRKPQTKVYEDTITLQVHFMSQRNELIKNFLRTPARYFTDSELTKELAGTEKQWKSIKNNEDNDLIDEMFGDLTKETSSQKLELNGVLYEIGDYIYFKQPQEQEQKLMRISNIEGRTLLGKQILFKAQIKEKEKKCYENEVFLTDKIVDVNEFQVVGKCLVLFTEIYRSFEPKHFDSKDIYVCDEGVKEDQFHQIKRWPYDDEHTRHELIEREEEIVVSRLGGGDLVEEETKLDVLLPRYETIYFSDAIRQVAPNGDQLVCCEQMNFANMWFRLGDCVLVFKEGQAHLDIIRIDKMWKSKDFSESFISGAWFARPSEVVHDESRLFFTNEVIAVDQKDREVNCKDIVAKCAVLTLKQYETERPTEISECDVFVCEVRVKGSDTTEGYCSLRPGTSKSGGKPNTNEDGFGKAEPMDLEYAKAIRKLKIYNLASTVIDEEIVTLKVPVTMERELSPLVLKTDTNLPAEVPDLNISDGHENVDVSIDLNSIQIDDETKEKCKDPAWLSQQPKLNAKSKSGYILFSAEIRKRVMADHPDEHFGQISRLVGAEWKTLTDYQKKTYEVRASYIAAERAKQEADDVLNCKQLQQGQIKVFPCKWDTCDNQFDCVDGLFEHLRVVHTTTQVKLSSGEMSNVCLWQTCLKYRKEGKPFPSLPRLFRHIKEKHMATSVKGMYPNQRGKNFFVYDHPDITANGPANVYTGGVVTKPMIQGGLFKHHPQGIPVAEHPAPPKTPPAVQAPPQNIKQHNIQQHTVVVHQQQPSQMTSQINPQINSQVQMQQQRPVANGNMQPHQNIQQQNMQQNIPHQNNHHQNVVQQNMQHQNVQQHQSSNRQPQQMQNGYLQHPQLTPNHPQNAHPLQQQQQQQYVQTQMANGSTVLVPVSNQTMVMNQGNQPHSVQHQQQSHPNHQPQMIMVNSQGTPVQAKIIHTYHHGPATSNGHIHPQQQNHVVHSMPSTIPYPTPSTNPNLDAGRSIIMAAKHPEPVFVAPSTEPIRVRRVLHSELYTSYLSTLHAKLKQPTISKFNKSVDKRTTPNMKFSPYSFIRPSPTGHRRPDQEMIRAMWTLRDKLNEETTNINAIVSSDITYQHL